MDYVRIASRIIEARRKPKNKRPPKVSKRPVDFPVSVESETMLRPQTEYSCRVEIALTADFEGNVAKKNLIKKLKNEIITAIKTGVEQVSTDMELQATGVVVSPLRVECAVNDQASVEDESNFIDDDFDDEEEIPPPKKKRRR